MVLGPKKVHFDHLGMSLLELCPLRFELMRKHPPTRHEAAPSDPSLSLWPGNFHRCSHLKEALCRKRAVLWLFFKKSCWTYQSSLKEWHKKCTKCFGTLFSSHRLLQLLPFLKLHSLFTEYQPASESKLTRLTGLPKHGYWTLTKWYGPPSKESLGRTHVQLPWVGRVTTGKGDLPTYGKWTK